MEESVLMSSSGKEVSPDVQALQDSGVNVPLFAVETLDSFDPDPVLGAAKYRHSLENGTHLDALLVNKRADVLVVSFHGATDREKNTLPRFERLRSFLDYEVSSMYFTDPALWLNHKNYFQLAWFTGWDGFDAQRSAVEWVMKAAKAIGASRILFTGASGGGFVALQVSALVPGSLALAFNPQTSIYGYLANGHAWGAQKNYRNVVWPHIDAPAVGPEMDWTTKLDDRVSALRRYSKPTANHVLYATNTLEFHHEQHYLPFISAAESGGNIERVDTFFYEHTTQHTPPGPEHFSAAMKEALSLISKLPPTDSLS
ncbi:hypothetical protein AAE021_03550 [Arthrobacter citreus]|uniref:Alpha/beta hydrolase n=1 Tax=Arthrobacter citreus TaxID=1670 RepID=A0ABZ2ZYD1_9MICC